MDDLIIRIDNFVERKSMSSVLSRVKHSPPPKVIIPNKLNFNPVTLERINKQLDYIINQIHAQ